MKLERLYQIFVKCQQMAPAGMAPQGQPAMASQMAPQGPGMVPGAVAPGQPQMGGGGAVPGQPGGFVPAPGGGAVDLNKF